MEQDAELAALIADQEARTQGPVMATRETAISRLTRGSEISVYWSEIGSWFHCKVSRIHNGCYTFDYDDGDVEIHQCVGGELFCIKWTSVGGRVDETSSTIATKWCFREVNTLQ